MPPGNNQFPTTSWTLVLSAVRDDGRRSALEQLCTAYWPPVLAYVRRHTSDIEEAKDITQAFFTRLLEKHDLRSAEPQRGRFRSFLLSAVKHFLSNERDRAGAQKRGGGRILLHLDPEGPEFQALPEATERTTPETIFERRWALLMLESALGNVRKHYDASGQARLFGCLKPFLTASRAGGRYQNAAEELGMNEAAIKMAMHRLRSRFARALREEIAKTVASPSEVDDEIRYLMSVLRA